jgi:hypothetical protein
VARFALALFSLLAWLLSHGESPAVAQYVEGPSARDIVVAYNTGLRFALAPGVIVLPDRGEVGFSIAGDMRYGFALKPIILAPGARVAGYFPPHGTAALGLATLRLTVPVGPLGPFVVGGAGPGYVSDPSRAGLAYLAGGGLMVHFGTRFAFGAEVAYQAIAATNFGVISFGPSFLIGF